MTLGKRFQKISLSKMGRQKFGISGHFPQLPALNPWGLMGWWGPSKSFGRSMLNPVMAWSPWRSPVAFFGDWMDWKKGIVANHAEIMLRFLGAEVAEAKHQHTLFQVRASSICEVIICWICTKKALESGSFGCKEDPSAFSKLYTWSKLETPKPETRNGRVISRKQLKPLRPKWFLDFAQLWGVFVVREVNI